MSESRKKRRPQRPKPKSELMTIVVIGLMFAVAVDFLIWRRLYRPFILKAKFEYADGIKPGAPVYLSGVKVGSVQGFRFLEVPRNSSSNEYFEIIFELNDEINGYPTGEMIRKDARATLIVTGSLGDRSIDIFPGTGLAPPTASGDYIKSDVEPNISMLVDRSQTMQDNFNRVLQIMEEREAYYKAGRGTMGRFNGKEFERNLENLQQETDLLMTELQSGKGTLSRFKRDKRLEDLLKRMETAVQKLRRDFDEGSGNVARFLKNQKELEERVATLQARFERVSALVEQLVERSRKGNGSLARIATDTEFNANLKQFRTSIDGISNSIEHKRGTLGLMLYDDSLSRNFSYIGAEIDRLVYDVRQNPRRYVKFTLF